MNRITSKNLRKPWFRIFTKLVFPVAALALIAGCTSFACAGGKIEEKQASVLNAEEVEVVSDSNNYAHYYEKAQIKNKFVYTPIKK